MGGSFGCENSCIKNADVTINKDEKGCIDVKADDNNNVISAKNSANTNEIKKENDNFILEEKNNEPQKILSEENKKTVDKSVNQDIISKVQVKELNLKSNEINKEENCINIVKENKKQKNKEINNAKEDKLKLENEEIEKENIKKENEEIEKKNISKKNEEINNLKKEKLALENEVKDMKNKLNIINNQAKILEKEKKQITHLKNEFAQKEQNIKNKEYNIKVKETELNNKENVLKKKEDQLNQREDKIIEKERKNKVVLIGLNNIGATCYMNATLQCLSNSAKMTEFFLDFYKNDKTKKMSNEYYKVIKNLWDVNSTQKSYSPYSFKEVLSQENELFAGIQANDSKDLINFLIERMHQELNVVNPNKSNNNDDNMNQLDQTNELEMLKTFIEEFHQKFNSPISNLFYGILETKTRCQGCSVIKFNFQIYSFLEFPLQQVNQYFFNNGKRPLFTQDGKNPDVDLYECFEYNRKIDLMNGENQMFCNICNKLCDSLYSTILYSGPIYLIINLNRGKGAVYECKVKFPNQLNILNYVTFTEGITTYELYAVICHLGPSSMSGHFVAYCRNRIDNKWYLYNDAFVTPCTKKYQYNDGMPYILFYRAIISD